jgi:hypothetical protein
VDDFPVMDEHQRLALSIAEHVRRNKFELAQECFVLLTKTPEVLEKYLTFLRRHFAAASQLEVLFDWFMIADPRFLNRIGLIGQAAGIGVAIGRHAQVLELMKNIAQSTSAKDIHFGSSDFLWRFMGLGKELVVELIYLKYRGLPLKSGGRYLIIEGRDLLMHSQAISDRIDLDQRVLDQLYSNRRNRSMQRLEWEGIVRNTCCLDHFIGDGLVEQLDGIIDQKANEVAFKQVMGSKGMLLVTFHGCFLTVARHLYSRAIKGGLILGLGGADSRVIPARGKHRMALFQALRAVEDGNVVLMAPDGTLGIEGSSSFMQVAGVTIPLANGAPFIAYETGCNSSWFTVMRKAECMIPIVEAAPKRAENENYEDFCQRWSSFYGQKIDSVLTGDPENLTLRARWSMFNFGSATRQNQRT